MKGVISRRVLCLILAVILLFGAYGCGRISQTDHGYGASTIPQADSTDREASEGTSEKTTASDRENPSYGGENLAADMMEGIVRNTVEGRVADEKFIRAMADFAVEIFRNYPSAEGEVSGDNVLISPLSSLLALAMTANGAAGETLSQMEAVLGGGMPISELNRYLYTYTNSLPNTEKAKFKIANSIWFRDRFDVYPQFLQANADYYGAAVRKEPFDDGTKDAINAWVNENTDGLIEYILSDSIPTDTMMYLINAIVFDAKWQHEYHLNDLREREFTAIDGTAKKVPMMWSEERKYLDDGKATGFIKPYANGYSFVALLPNEGVDIHEYIASMTGDNLIKTLNQVENASVSVTLPKFSYEDDTLMNAGLIKMGMPLAFGSLADFTGMTPAGENIYIDNVLQKTFISVDELGTKAGAATMIEMTTESVPSYQYTVTLNRPFVYMIIDNETKLPAFIGALLEMQE